MIPESGTVKGMGMQIDSSICDDFHGFPSIDVHKPVVTDFQSSIVLIADQSKRHQEQKQVGEQSMTTSTHEQVGGQAKQAKHVVDLKSVESQIRVLQVVVARDQEQKQEHRRDSNDTATMTTTQRRQQRRLPLRQ